jgi:hypothetical protein
MKISITAIIREIGLRSLSIVEFDFFVISEHRHS